MANLPDVEAINGDRALAAAVLPALKDELGVQELSYYAKDYQGGGAALFYGGPIVARRFVFSQHTIEVRDALITETIATREPTRGISIAPGSSQIIGVAPILSDDVVNGVIVAVYVVDESYVQDIGETLGVDAAIVKDNAPIASIIDETSGYELMLQDGFIDPAAHFTAETVQYADGVDRRLLSHQLVIDDQPQGHLLVARTIQDVVALQVEIQNLVLGFVGVIVVMMLIFGIAVIYNFAVPLGRLVRATEKSSFRRFFATGSNRAGGFP